RSSTARRCVSAKLSGGAVGTPAAAVSLVCVTPTRYPPAAGRARAPPRERSGAGAPGGGDRLVQRIHRLRGPAEGAGERLEVPLLERAGRVVVPARAGLAPGGVQLLRRVRELGLAGAHAPSSPSPGAVRRPWASLGGARVT